MNAFITFARSRAVLACLLGFSAVSVSAAPQVSLFPESPDLGQPFQIELQGEWAQACTPSIGDSWVDGDEIVVKLQDAGKRCGDQPRAARVLRSPSATPLTVEHSGTLRIRVLGGSPERTQAFGLAAVGDVELFTPESGLWWPERGGAYDTSGPGLGVQIEVQGDALALNLSGYDNAGTPFWWFAAGDSQSLPQSLSLTALKGGSGPFAKYAAPNDALSGGTVHIEWLSSGRGVFWFVRPDAADPDALDVRPVSMARFAFGVRPGDSWRGDWVLLRRDAEGIVTASAINFAGHKFVDNGFELITGDGLLMRCEQSAKRPDSPPTGCSLSDRNGALGQLTDIGLKRMQGYARNGDAIRLTKVDEGF